jgi:hypothetical protein
MGDADELASDVCDQQREVLAGLDRFLESLPLELFGGP